MKAAGDISKSIEGLGIPSKLCEDLVGFYQEIMHEVLTSNLGKSTVGKFVETIVQIFQSLDQCRAGYEMRINNVDSELSSTYESRTLSGIPDDSRLAIGRIARAMYCLRNKRSIAHKNALDPNLVDLTVVLQCAKWILAELVRLATNSPSQQAKDIIEDLQRPLLPLVEEVLGKQVVLDPNLTTKQEVLIILLHNYGSGPISRKELGKATDRRSSSAVSDALTALKKQRLVESTNSDGIILTRLGLSEVERLIRSRI